MWPQRSSDRIKLFRLAPPRTLLAIAGFLLAGSTLAQVSIDWHSVDAGGGISSEVVSDIEIIGVIGQSDTVRMSSGNISLSGGYLPLPVNEDGMFKNGFE